MPTTTNFGWTTPADTDLVKDGASAIRTLGNGIDTSLVDLKGGTTGQVLSKASNTDMDFTWSSVDPLTILDAKADLITATAADTPARLAVGSDGQVLTADSSTSTGLKWATASSGGMTQIASGSLSGSSVNLTTISSSYVDLYLVIRDMNITSAGQVLNMRFNNNSSGIYQLSNSSSSGYQVNATDTSLQLGPGNYSTSGGDNSFAIYINDYTSASMKIGTAISFFVENAGGFGLGDLRYVMRSTTAISEINLFMTTGNFSGSYILYGVK